MRAAVTWLRSRLKSAALRSARRLSETDEGRTFAADTLTGLLAWRPALPAHLKDLPSPYPELGKADSGGKPSGRGDAVFITARFRSGSTLLWNMFRNLDGFTSYYEPFNERRWFDPHVRNRRIDPTHRYVEDYWREYDGLAILGDYYDQSWVERNLFMDADFWNPKMKRYVELLIDKAPGRPVLQFNRIDFRLPWIRRNFPGVRVIHLYRQPRDQWCSSFMGHECFPKDGKMSGFESHDEFYLLMWARDLKHHFPFLDERTVSHPYQLFYYIWKLSYLFGVQYAHHSVAFEHLIEHSQSQLTELFRELSIEQYDLDRLERLIVKPSFGKWREYADDGWFTDHESACESVLAEFLADDSGSRT